LIDTRDEKLEQLSDEVPIEQPFVDAVVGMLRKSIQIHKSEINPPDRLLSYK